MISDGDCLTMASISLFARTVVIADCVESYLVNMESLSSDLKAWKQRAERTWSILWV